MCNKTKFLPIMFFVWCTLIAQTILTTRIYAVTMKNTMITAVFVCITVPQLALGIYQTTLAAKAPAQRLPPIHLPGFEICIFTRHRNVEIAFTGMSLFYDASAFLVIVILAVRWRFKGEMSRIFRTIVHDTTIYFFVIFTAHFILVMTLLLARPTLQLLPASAGTVFLPTMIGRLMLSLKRAADTSNAEWSLTTTTFTRDPYASKRLPLQFASFSNRDTELRTDGDIPLGTISSSIP